MIGCFAILSPPFDFGEFLLFCVRVQWLSWLAVNLTQTREIPEKREPHQRNCLQARLWGIFLIAADCESGSKLVSNFLFLRGLCFSSCLYVPSLSSFLGSPDNGLRPANQKHPLPPKLLLAIVLMTAAENKIGHWRVILQNLVSGETTAVNPSHWILSALGVLCGSVCASVPQFDFGHPESSLQCSFLIDPAIWVSHGLILMFIFSIVGHIFLFISLPVID